MTKAFVFVAGTALAATEGPNPMKATVNPKNFCSRGADAKETMSGQVTFEAGKNGGLDIHNAENKDDVSFALEWDLQGLDPRCYNGPCDPDAKSGPTMCGKLPPPLSCGVHLHKGVTCGEMRANDPTCQTGDHLWNPAYYSPAGMGPADDPWMKVTYKTASNTTGDAKGHFTILEGYPTLGYATAHAVVLHDFQSNWIGCATMSLGKQWDEAFLGADAYGKVDAADPWSGELLSSASASIKTLQAEKDTVPKVQIDYDLVFTKDPGCKAGAEKKAACGIRIGFGTSCSSNGMPHDRNQLPVMSIEAASFGMFNNGFTTPDLGFPQINETSVWGNVTWTSKAADGKWAAKDTAFVQTGYLSSQMRGHPLYFTNSTGDMVACAMLPFASTSSAAGLGLIAAFFAAIAQ